MLFRNSLKDGSDCGKESKKKQIFVEFLFQKTGEFALEFFHTHPNLY